MFDGMCTAIVTPFKNGYIDFIAYENLINLQLENNVKALVVLGTTGEAPNINLSERTELIKFTKKIVNNKIPIIIGAGTNSTQKTLELVKNAEECGADAVLLVTPYYNKPTQEGLFHHYKYIAENTKLKIILYNVPGRTGVNMQPETVLKLARNFNNIIGLKEANSDINHIDKTISLLKSEIPNFKIYSGNDDRTFYFLCAGADGVISVASNIIPHSVAQLCDSIFKNDIKNAAQLHFKLLPIFKGLFIETNPIPVKTALYILGYIENEFRLPLVKASDTTFNFIKDLLKKEGLL